MLHLLHPVLDRKMLVWYADFVPLCRLVTMRLVVVRHTFSDCTDLGFCVVDLLFASSSVFCTKIFPTEEKCTAIWHLRSTLPLSPVCYNMHTCTTYDLNELPFKDQLV